MAARFHGDNEIAVCPRINPGGRKISTGFVDTVLELSAQAKPKFEMERNSG